MEFSLTNLKAICNSLGNLGPSRLMTRLLRVCRYRFIYPRLGPVVFRKTTGSYEVPPSLFNSITSIPPADARDRLLTEAEALSRQTFTFLNLPPVTFSPKVDWQYAPNQDPLWQYCLHYGEWALTLAQAFRLTNDSRYQQILMNLIVDWLEHNPPGSTPGWEPYPISRRLVAWSKAAAALWPDEAWQSFWRGAVAPSLHQQVRVLMANLETDLANNHLLANYRAVAWMGLMFPEWPEAARWRNFGLTGLWAEMDRQVLADGVHDERSISYHAIVLADLLETWDLCQKLGVEVPRQVEEKLSLMVQFLKDMQAPDHSYPMVNDTIPGYPDYLASDPLQVAARSNAWPGLFFKSEGANPAQSMTKAGVSAYPQAGYVILRDEPGDFLCFDAGPMGPAHLPGHGHADALSFTLYALGRPIIVDPSVYSYHERHWRDHFRSTMAHNTVCIDDQDQCVFWGPFRVAYPPRAYLLSWSDEHVEGEHEGYLRLSDPVTHRRKIKRLGHNQWEIKDHFVGRGEHKFALTLQMAPEAKVTREGSTGISVRWPGLRLKITAPEPAPGSSASVEPGWVSPGWHLKVEAPRYVLQWKAHVPTGNRLLISLEN